MESPRELPPVKLYPLQVRIARVVIREMREGGYVTEQEDAAMLAVLNAAERHPEFIAYRESCATED